MMRQLTTAIVAMWLVPSLAYAQTPVVSTAGEALFALVNRAGTFLVTDGLLSLITSQTSTFPVSASAGAFVYRFDPALRVPTRRTASFGPTFAQRPLTSGARTLNIGVSFQHTTFDSVDGLPLDSIRWEGIPLTGDSGLLSLQVELDRTVVSATYGIANRVDVGVLVPFGRSRVSGSYSCSCFRLGRVMTFNADRSSSGIGDVELQTKVELASINVLDLAASFDMRLPTGDKEKLLGSGAAQGKITVIGATRHRVVAPHVNVSYVFGGKGFTRFPGGSISLPRHLEGVQPSPEFDYTVGVDAAMTSRVTIAGDLLGRSLTRSVRIYTLSGPSFSEPAETAGAVNLVLGALGSKINFGGPWLATFTVLFPLNSSGLKPRVTPVVGFEAVF